MDTVTAPANTEKLHASSSFSRAFTLAVTAEVLLAILHYPPESAGGAKQRWRFKPNTNNSLAFCLSRFVNAACIIPTVRLLHANQTLQQRRAPVPPSPARCEDELTPFVTAGDAVTWSAVGALLSDLILRGKNIS